MRARGDELLAWARGLDAGAPAKFAPRPESEAAARCAAEAFLGDRDRDAAARSLCGLCASHPGAGAARPAAARSRRRRARHTVPRHTAPLFRDRHPTARSGGAGAPAARWPARVSPQWRCRPTSRPSGGRASQTRPRRSSPGRRGRARRRASARRRGARRPARRSATPGVTLSGYADRIDLLPAGRPTSSTTRPDRRLPRRRRTRCWRRSSRWKARC